jgi:hypothetical protein
MSSTNEGWLWKRGFVNTAYKKRFFRFDGANLRYFENESSSIERGTIQVSKIRIVESEFILQHDCCEFILKPKLKTDRTYYLKADSADEKGSWMSAISQRIDISSSAPATEQVASP